MSPRPDFRGGRNIAMKVPSNQWDATLRFYRDITGTKVVCESKSSTSFEFGLCRFHVDRCNYLSQAEIWLELFAAVDRPNYHVVCFSKPSASMFGHLF